MALRAASVNLFSSGLIFTSGIKKLWLVGQQELLFVVCFLINYLKGDVEIVFRIN